MHKRQPSNLSKRSPSALALACATVLSSNAGAQGFDITTADAYDQDFDPANWRVELATQNAIAAPGTFTQVATGGDPGSYALLEVGVSTVSPPPREYVAVVYEPFSFNPACEGTIDSVVHRWTKQGSTLGNAIALVATQDGNLKMGGEAANVQPVGVWTAEAVTATVADINASGPTSLNADIGDPDLDPSGGPVQFGFAFWGASTAGPRDLPIDNWSVVINTTGGTPEYNVGGSVTGLAGSVTLQNNGGDDLVLSANGAFTGFSTGMTCGAAYNVTVAAQPTGQLCTVSNGAGSVADPTPADISDVSVSCVTATSELTLVTAITSGDPYAAAGVSVSYSYTVTNSGNVALAGPVSITDDTVTGVSCPAVTTVGNNDANLDPSEVLVCSGTYTVTQADVDAGSLTNSATASADGTTSAASGATGTAAPPPPPPPPAAPATPVPVAGLWALILTTLSVVFMGGVASRRRRAR